VSRHRTNCRIGEKNHTKQGKNQKQLLKEAKRKVEEMIEKGDEN